MSPLLVLLAFCALTSTPTRALPDLPEIYDFVVIGGGTAGSLVARQLSDNLAWTVLVLDTGYDQSNTMWTTPSIYKNVFTGIPDHQRTVDNTFTYEPVPGVSPFYWKSQEAFITRDTLGGASAINGNFPQRPSRADLDLFVAATGNPLWSYNNTDAHWRALETWNSSDPLHLHGHSGPIMIQTFEERKQAIHTELHAKMATGLGIPVLADGNVGEAEGVSFAARNIAAGPSPFSEGVRQDTWTRILKPVSGRPNLVIKTLSKVVKISTRRQYYLWGDLIADSVNYIEGGVSKIARAWKEIILCAGVFGSPQILLQSGIGPAAELAALGIDVVVDNPNVGKHLVGNVGYLMQFARLQLTGLPDPPALPYTDPTTPYGLIQTSAFRSPGANRTDLEISISIIRADQAGLPTPDMFGVLVCQNIVPVEGTVSLRNANPFAAVNITYGYMANPANIQPMVYGLKKARQIMASLDPLIGLNVELNPGAALPPTATDAEYTTFVLQNAHAEWHDSSTCRAGTTLGNSVVDGRLKVHGIKRLRVIDNSILPYAPASHSAAGSALLIGKVGGSFVVADN